MENNLANIERQCKDCLKPFIITEGEQEWYNAKGFAFPVRCPECRKFRKAQRESAK